MCACGCGVGVSASNTGYMMSMARTPAFVTSDGVQSLPSAVNQYSWYSGMSRGMSKAKAGDARNRHPRPISRGSATLDLQQTTATTHIANRQSCLSVRLSVCPSVCLSADAVRVFFESSQQLSITVVIRPPLTSSSRGRRRSIPLGIKRRHQQIRGAGRLGMEAAHGWPAQHGGAAVDGGWLLCCGVCEGIHDHCGGQQHEGGQTQHG